MTKRFDHIWNRPVLPAEITPCSVDIGAIETLSDLRRRNAEALYQHFAENCEEEEIAESESFFAVGCNKMRCFYWTIADSGHSRKNSFTVTFEHNSGVAISSF